MEREIPEDCPGEGGKGASPTLPCPQGMNNGGIARRSSHLSKRIAFFPQNAVGAQNPVLVLLPDPSVRNESSRHPEEPRARIGRETGFHELKSPVR